MYDPHLALLAYLFPRQYVKTRDRILDGLWNFVIPVIAVVLVGLVVALAAGWFK